jgi:monofunctional biosynthetic peptidoglycan transglycosylase
VTIFRKVLGWRAILRFLVALSAIAFAIAGFCWATLPDVRPLRTTIPATTAFMDLRARQAATAGRTARPVRHIVRYSRISPLLVRAVLAAEDAAFFSHDGLDYDEIRESISVSFEQGILVRGASTITQQLAKNLYLSPSRNPYRKVRELLITRRLEAELTKTRILELYLNVVEWGEDVWGAEAAARRYFGVTAAELTAEQAALLAGALINPRLYSPAQPNARLLRRQQIILGRMGPRN